MHKLEKLHQELNRQLENAHSPILCFSGGKDSMFLLSQFKAIKKEVPVLMFDVFWSQQYKKKMLDFIEKNQLTAFSYQPDGFHYEKHDEGESVIAFYPLGQKHLPIIADVIETEVCGLDVSAKALKTMPLLGYSWDVTFTGSKATDTHPLTKKLDFVLDFSKFSTSEYRISTPLWDWTDAEVIESLGTDIESDTDFHACLRCQRNERVFCPKLQKMIGE